MRSAGSAMALPTADAASRTIAALFAYVVIVHSVFTMRADISFGLFGCSMSANADGTAVTGIADGMRKNLRAAVGANHL